MSSFLIIEPKPNSICSQDIQHFVWNSSQIGIIRPCLYGEKLSYRRFTLVPELPWARQLFLRFLTKLGEPFTWQTKIFLSRRGDTPRRATRFSWYTHAISLYKHFGSPIWVNSVKARQSEHTRALLTRVKRSIFVSCKHSLKLTRLGGWPPDLGQFFSIWTARA